MPQDAVSGMAAVCVRCLPRLLARVGKKFGVFAVFEQDMFYQDFLDLQRGCYPFGVQAIRNGFGSDSLQGIERTLMDGCMFFDIRIVPFGKKLFFMGEMLLGVPPDKLQNLNDFALRRPLPDGPV